MTEKRERIRLSSLSSARKTKTMTMVVLVLVLTVIVGAGTTSTEAAPSPAQCALERRLGINACKPLLYGIPPSPECCERIRVTDVQCVCPVITPKLAALVGDVTRAIKIIQGCGRPVPRHFKCGSITTP